MKILHVTDLHFHTPWFYWVSLNAPDYDAVAISGDLLDIFNPRPLEDQIEWVSSWLRHAPVPFVICSGNHDLDEPPHCRWLSPLSIAREQLKTDRQMLRRGQWTIEAVPFGEVPLRGGENHVVITHLPPAGAPTAQARYEDVDCGDEHLARHLRMPTDKPWLILSGHIHLPQRWRARSGAMWSLNPGSSPDAHPQVPNHIALDLTAGEAAWRDGWGNQSRVRLR